MKKQRVIFALSLLTASLAGGAAFAFEFQESRATPDKPIRLDRSSAPEDTFASLSPSAGNSTDARRAAVIVNVPNESYWTPYFGAGAGYRPDPVDFNLASTDYNFMAGTMLQTDPDPKGRQHQLTFGYRFNESSFVSNHSGASSLSRDPSHNLEVDWRYKF